VLNFSYFDFFLLLLPLLSLEHSPSGVLMRLLWPRLLVSSYWYYIKTTAFF